jgi:hypothetical protein
MSYTLIGSVMDIVALNQMTYLTSSSNRVYILNVAWHHHIKPVLNGAERNMTLNYIPTNGFK